MSSVRLVDCDISIANTQVCTSLNLDFKAGENWCILGMNGCGKTTLLHTLAGLLELDSGAILLNDHSIHSLSRKAVAQQLGILMQHQEDHFPGNVMETVLVGRHPHLSNWQWETDTDYAITRNALESVGLAGFEDRSITHLSGGERQRVALATLLVQQTAVRLLDEPVNHLDIHHQQQMMEMICANNQDIVNILVLHDINLASRYCDHALLILGNGKTMHGNTTDILTETNLSELYQCNITSLPHQDHRIFVTR